MAYPLRVVFVLEEKKEAELVSVMVSVPKKRFKRAVKRNLLKRRMREAYRLNKPALLEKLEAKQLQLHVAFNYVSNDLLDFEKIDRKMKIALQKIMEKIDLK